MPRLFPFSASLVGSSVFVKCTALVALSVLVVASVLTFLNLRTMNAVIVEGVQALGTEITQGAAGQSGAAIRFGKMDLVQANLQQIIDGSGGQATFAIVVDSEGQTLVSIGTAEDGAASELAALGASVAGEGVAQASADGFLIAAPALAGETAVGAIGISWTPAPALAEARAARSQSLLVGAAVFLGMVFMSVMVLRPMLSQPLRAVAGVIDGLSERDYGQAVPHLTRADEIGGIARNVEALQEQLAKAAAAEEERIEVQAQQRVVVEALTAGLNDLSAGNLSQQLDQEFSGDYEALRQNFNNTVDRMVQIIEQVIENTNTIKMSAAEINQSSQSLAQRTESQAASLEETAAAIDQITSNVRSSAAGAKQVEEIVNRAQSTAKQSDEVVKQAVGAMSKIEDSSKQISQIISVIDDIAFQTNLLALNAAVEAARAGEAGRGFAVVATEVRALAQRSSDAAREIKDLITQSGDQVEQGVDLVGRAGEELQTIIESVSTISEHVRTITASAAEQSTTLEEINSGVTQLDQVTQQNAAMVEEATASSEVLRNEAGQLAASVAIFQLPNDNEAREVRHLSDNRGWDASDNQGLQPTGT